MYINLRWYSIESSFFSLFLISLSIYLQCYVILSILYSYNLVFEPISLSLYRKTLHSYFSFSSLKQERSVNM